MPTYQYCCDDCGHTLQVFQSMSDAPQRECPQCNHSSLVRVISGGLGVIFKGGGFYVNDSKKGGGGGGGKPAASDKTADNKTADNAASNKTDSKTADNAAGNKTGNKTAAASNSADTKSAAVAKN